MTGGTYVLAIELRRAASVTFGALARGVGGERTDGVGASDCDCPAHLVYVPGRAELRRSVAAAWEGHDPADPPPRPDGGRRPGAATGRFKCGFGH